MNQRLASSQIREIKSHLKKGGLIAYPTESCYGIGCIPFKNKALRKLIFLKKRSTDKGLISIGYHMKQFNKLLSRLPETTINHLNKQWPAAKTYLLPAHKLSLPLLRGNNRRTIALRIPDHKMARMLCQRLSTPLVSSSANRHKGKVCTHAREVRRLFGSKLKIINGQIGHSKKPSQIIDIDSKKIIR